jgi:hypothetical protein
VRFTGDKGTLPEFRTKRDVAGLSPVLFECNQEVVEVWPLALICAERTRQTRRFQSSGAPRVPLSPRGERREIERQRAVAQNYAERLRAGSEPALVCPGGGAGEELVLVPAASWLLVASLVQRPQEPAHLESVPCPVQTLKGRFQVDLAPFKQLSRCDNQPPRLLHLRARIPAGSARRRLHSPQTLFLKLQGIQGESTDDAHPGGVR